MSRKISPIRRFFDFMNAPPDPGRRKFLGLGLATVAVIASGCRPKFSPPKELRSVSYDSEYVIFNGKTVSFSELDIATLSYAASARDKLNEIRRGILPQTNPSGYLGNSFPADWELDAVNKSAIIINQTDTGDYISQILIGRKRVGKIPLSDGGATDFTNSLIGASAYDQHSLMVIGRKGQTLWFDNVESENENGKTRIVVDGREGKVYQINSNSPNVLRKWFKGEEIQMNIHEIDIVSGETDFQQTLTPFHEKFISFLTNFINKLPTNLDKDQKLEKIKSFFSGSRLSFYKIEELKKLLGESNETQSMIEMIKRYKADLPFNPAELAVVSGILSKVIGNEIPNDSFSDKIRGIIPAQADSNIDSTERIINERVSLPMTASELYFIQVKNQKEQLKWFLVGRYSVRENDVDRTVITSNSDGFSIGERWYTFGEIDSAVVNNKLLRESETKIKAFPFDEIVRQDSNGNNPLMGEIFGGTLGLVEARKVSSDAIIYGWDPSESNPKHKINPGLKIVDENGDIRFLKVNYDKFWNNNIQDLPIFSNRWIPILGNSPRIIKDVSENVIRLIQQGYDSTSPFGLDAMADYSLYANLVSGTYTDYAFLSNSFPPEIYTDLIQPSEFLRGGIDNTILISALTKDGEPVKIYRYNTSNGQKIGEIEVEHPVIISPQQISTFEDGSAYVIIAEGKDETIVVREEDVFPLGARSAEKLEAIMFAEVAVVIAAIYGGFTLASKLGLTKGFSEKVVSLFAKRIIAPQ